LQTITLSNKELKEKIGIDKNNVREEGFFRFIDSLSFEDIINIVPFVLYNDELSYIS
jgi:hypothetical protein